MKETTLSTEDRIREAARRVFLEKGYDGTTSRDLAEAAGMNVAMTNYYFRSKEKLFQLVFTDLHRSFFEKLNEFTNRDIPLRDKVLLMIEAEFELVRHEPRLPMFVLYELQHNLELFADLIPPALTPDSLLSKQITAAIASGEMPDIQPVQLLILILANVQHPYMARAAIAQGQKMTDQAFDALMARHQQTVTDMLMGYLFRPGIGPG